MNNAQSFSTVSVALVALPETSPGTLYSLFEVFASVGRVWEDLTGQPDGSVRMQVDIIAENIAPSPGAMGVPISPTATFSSSPTYDVVVAPDMTLQGEFDPRGRWPEACKWLNDQFDNQAILSSVCTGAVLLAESGLLDNTEATSHWGVTPLFEMFYPEVELHAERILSLSGTEQRIITTGGSASWTELAIYLIARLCSREEAIRITKVFLLGDRSDGQLPFATMTRSRNHSDGAIAKCQVWIAENYQITNPVARMAEFARLHPRTFKRRFKAATGYSPLDYVQTLRIEEAKQMLEAEDQPTDDIALSVGYEDPASFRRLFKRMTGVTPARYRQRFRIAIR